MAKPSVQEGLLDGWNVCHCWFLLNIYIYILNHMLTFFEFVQNKVPKHESWCFPKRPFFPRFPTHTPKISPSLQVSCGLEARADNSTIVSRAGATLVAVPSHLFLSGIFCG